MAKKSDSKSSTPPSPATRNMSGKKRALAVPAIPGIKVQKIVSLKIRDDNFDIKVLATDGQEYELLVPSPQEPETTLVKALLGRVGELWPQSQFEFRATGRKITEIL